MRVLLVTTLSPHLVKVWLCQQTSTAGSRVPPADLASLAASLKQDGHEVAIVELRYAPNALALFGKIQDTFRPDAMVLNLTTPSAPLDYQLFEATRPGVRRIAFGTHAIALPEEAFEHGIDTVLWGDPEVALRHALAEDSEVTGRPGVLTPGRTMADTPPAYFASLDDAPYQDLSLLDLKEYHAPYVPRGHRFTMMLSARGCPFRCTFCQNPVMFGPKYRSQSAARVVDEILYLRDRFSISEVVFLDATFNVSEKSVTAFCEEMIRRQAKVAWHCNMRVEPAPLEMLRLMKRAGCRRIMLGVEDTRLLEEVRKGVTSDEVFAAFRAARQAGLSTVAYFMLFPNAPYSQKEYPIRMLDLIRALDPDAFQLNIAIPLPGTPLYDEMAERGCLSGDWTAYDPGGDRMPYQSDLDLVAVRNQVIARWPFMHPIRTLRQVSDLDLRSFIAAGHRYLRGLL